MGSCQSDIQVLTGAEATIEKRPGKMASSPSLDCSEDTNMRTMWGLISPYKEQIAQEVHSRVFGDRRFSFIATHSRSLSTRSISSLSSTDSATSTSSMSISTNSSLSSSLSPSLRHFQSKSTGEINNRFVKVVSMVLKCDLDTALLQLCILGEIYGGFSLFLDAFVAALKTVLVCGDVDLPDDKVEQFVFFVGDMVELLRDDVTLHSGFKETEILDDQTDISEANEFDMELFYDFWVEKIVNRGIEDRLALRVSKKLFESSSHLRSMFKDRCELRRAVIDHLIRVFSDSTCENLSSIYDKLINCQKVLTSRHFSQIGQAFILSLKDELGSEFSADHIARFRKLYRIFLIPVVIGFQHTLLQKKTRRRPDGKGPRKCPKASVAAQMRLRAMLANQQARQAQQAQQQSRSS